MSIRIMRVQYLGNALRLPKLERDVVLIATEDGKRYVPERTCTLKCHKDNWAGGWWNEYGCGYKLLVPWDADDVAEDYCPKCGGRIAD